MWMHFPGAEEARLFCLPCSLISAAIRGFLGDGAAVLAQDPGVLLYIDGTGDGSTPLRVRLMHEKLDTGAAWTQMPNSREQRAKLNLPDYALEIYTLKGMVNSLSSHFRLSAVIYPQLS